MTLFVREYSWMWTDLHLSLAECRVYAYIYGLSHGEKKGYDGSKRHLAELLGLDAGGVKKILDTLTEKHLIVCTDGLWHSVESVNTPSVESVNESIDSVNKSVESVNSPYNPLNNNITDKKQADMPTDLFEKFFKKFVPEFKNRFTVTWYNFDKRSPAAQQAMWNAVKDDSSCKTFPTLIPNGKPAAKPAKISSKCATTDGIKSVHAPRWNYSGLNGTATGNP